MLAVGIPMILQYTVVSMPLAILEMFVRSNEHARHYRKSLQQKKRVGLHHKGFEGQNRIGLQPGPKKS